MVKQGVCITCGKEIDPKYKYCIECINDFKAGLKSQPADVKLSSNIISNNNKVVEQLTFINWNLGRIVAVLENNPKLKKDILKDIKELKK